MSVCVSSLWRCCAAISVFVWPALQGQNNGEEVVKFRCLVRPKADVLLEPHYSLMFYNLQSKSVLLQPNVVYTVCLFFLLLFLKNENDNVPMFFCCSFGSILKFSCWSFFWGSFSMSGVCRQRLFYAVQTVKPLQSNCDLWSWAV